MTQSQPALEDGVVILTPFSLRDVGSLVEANRDGEMAKRFDFPPGPPAKGEARRAIKRWQRSWRTRRLVAFAVRALATRDLIGGCELRVHKHEVANVSYFTVPDRRGRGVATRAVKLLSDFGLDELQLKRLEIRTEVDNLASQAVAEKAGFTREGVLRSAGQYRRGRRDLVLYSRLPDEQLRRS